MNIGIFQDFKSVFRKPALRHGQAIAGLNVKGSSQAREHANILEVDLHTQKDLEIFDSNAASKSLYDLCDSTRTEGGAQILRDRMQNPFSDATNIRRAQISIAYIPPNREVFEKLGHWVTGRVERYLKEPLMYVIQKGRIGFTLEALILRVSDGYHFIRILRGVQFTCLFVQKMREFQKRLQIDPPKGELAVLSARIESIISQPEYLEIPEYELTGRSFLKILRIDQTFRVYGKESLEELLHIAYELDALISMADVTHNLAYCMPTILDGETEIHATDLAHPQVENPVPNDVKLDQSNRLLFLTGPNMAGKTTYLRSVATALYLGHLGMGVPVKRFSFTPVDRLFSSIAISDDVHTGTSYFLAEVLRVKSLAHTLSKGQRVVAIMDEPFKGTNVSEALEASLAVMLRLEQMHHSIFLFSSHLIELEESFTESNNIQKCHFEAREDVDKLQFDYRLKPGVSRQRLGMRVMMEEGVFDLLDEVISMPN